MQKQKTPTEIRSLHLFQRNPPPFHILEPGMKNMTTLIVRLLATNN